jgi:hypothetical protein
MRARMVIVMYIGIFNAILRHTRRESNDSSIKEPLFLSLLNLGYL